MDDKLEHFFIKAVRSCEIKRKMELENGIGSKPRPRRNDALEQAKLEGPRRRRIFIMYHGVKDPANLLPTMMTGIR